MMKGCKLIKFDFMMVIGDSYNCGCVYGKFIVMFINNNEIIV